MVDGRGFIFRADNANLTAENHHIVSVEVALQCPGTSAAQIMPVKPRYYFLGELILPPQAWVKL